MATLGSLDLGIVENESRTKDAQLFTQALPASDSVDSIIVDLFGVLGTLVLSGKKTVTSVADANTFCNSLDALVVGTQSRIVYTSDSTLTFNVYVQSVEYKRNEGAPIIVEYTINLIEGAA